MRIKFNKHEQNLTKNGQFKYKKKQHVGYFCDTSLGSVSSLQNRKLCIN